VTPTTTTPATGTGARAVTADLARRLAAALAGPGRPSSDYDLNPAVALPPGRRLVPAAVLVGIVDMPGAPEVVLTKRSPRLRHHPGQVAFPGGKIDPGDADAAGAALREAGEEVGLRRAQAEVIGTLPAHETVTGFSVTPVVARIAPPFRPVAEEGEVSEVFTVPLAHVLAPARYRVESRLWRGQERRYFAVPYGPYYIWGATARILRALADRMA